tara:strand:- start:182 stop:685 length:504 start_codon:yes stop_codon:yes gene_type:complete
MRDAVDEFWCFSLALYERPGIADILNKMQDEDGVDVNLTLFLCWCGAAGRTPLDRRQLTSVMESIANWQSDVTVALRQIRRRMKGGIAGVALCDSGPLREKIKSLELASERIAQRVLAGKAPPASRVGGSADVIVLLKMYFKMLNLPDSLRVRAAIERLAEACILEN